MDLVRNYITAFDSQRRIASAYYNSPRACPRGAVLWQCLEWASMGEPLVVTDRSGLNDVSPGYLFKSANYVYPVGIAMHSLPANKDLRLFAICKNGTVEFEPRITITPSDLQYLAGKPVIVDSEGEMLAVSSSELLMSEAVMKTSSLASDDSRVVLTSQTLASGVYYHIGYYIQHAAPSRWVSGVEVFQHNRLLIDFCPKFIFVKA
jgi:hypothetical protein